MQTWTEIRRMVLVEGASKRSIRRDYRIGSVALEKILAQVEPAGYRQQLPRPEPVLGQFLPVIEAILVEDRVAPVKQRPTAKRPRQCAINLGCVLCRGVSRTPGSVAVPPARCEQMRGYEGDSKQ